MFGISARLRAVFIIWVHLNTKRLTMDRLQNWVMKINPIYVMFQKEPKTSEHLFVLCDVTGQL